MRVFFTFTVTVTLVVLSLISAPVEAGDSGVIRPGSYVVVVGGEVSVSLRASGITEPGLDAWVLDVAYNPAILRAVSCESLQGGVCNAAFSEDTVRATGADLAEGLTGTFPLAMLTFVCEAPGTSVLFVQEVFTTISEPPSEGSVDLRNGSITCLGLDQRGLIRIGSSTAVVGEDVTVALEAVDIPAEGALGVWTVDVTYDASVVSLVECNAQLGGVCNPAHGENTLRVTGASAGGLSGTATLAEIAFVCSRAGATDLAVRLSIGGSFPVGDVPSFPDPVSGTITCTDLPAKLPTTGTAASQPASPPAAVPLALLGAVLLAAAFAFRRYAAR